MISLDELDGLLEGDMEDLFEVSSLPGYLEGKPHFALKFRTERTSHYTVRVVGDTFSFTVEPFPSCCGAAIFHDIAFPDRMDARSLLPVLKTMENILHTCKISHGMMIWYTRSRALVTLAKSRGWTVDSTFTNASSGSSLAVMSFTLPFQRGGRRGR